MQDWKKETTPVTLKGQISVPYTWWVGLTGSRFLISLRDRKKITASRCPECGKVYVPPRKNCGRCYKDIEETAELGSEGEVGSFTVVRFPFKMHPAEAPFAYALIKLDGADVRLLHIIKKDLHLLKRGARVRAVFSEKREGHILDITCFEIIS